MNIEKHKITNEKFHIGEGETIAYTLFEADTSNIRPRITLLHSLALNRKFWNPVVNFLIQHADILTLDIRGHGESTVMGGKFTTELFARDIASLLEHVGWNSTSIAGASMGGCIALAFASNYPEKTNALGLIDTTAWYGSDAPMKWKERSDKAVKEGMSALVDFQKTRWFTDSFRQTNTSIVEDTIKIFEKTDLNAFANTCQMMGDFDLRQSLSSLRMPTSILVGAEDYATPIEMAQLLHSEISQSTLQIIKNARHLTPIECPQIVSDGLINLLNKIQKLNG